MKEKTLVRNGHHQRPMHAVLERYGIGSHDTYDRGLWIFRTDLPKIYTAMTKDPTHVEGEWNGKPYIFVQGSNRHNDVLFDSFQRLFNE